MVVILLTVIVLIVGILYWKHKINYSYWNDRNIVSLPVLPIVGSYGKFLTFKYHISQIINEIYSNHRNAKYVGGFKGSEPELIVRDPDVIKEILVKDFNYFMDRGMAPLEKDILNQNLFYLGGEKWKTLRQKMTPTFTSSKIKKMFPLIKECGEEHELCIKEKLNNDSIEIKELMAKFTTDTIGTCAFGLHMNAMKDEESPFRKIGISLFQIDKLKTILRTSSFLMKLAKLFNINPRANQKTLETFFVNLVKQLIASRPTPSPRQDFIDNMLELKTKGFIEVSKDDIVESYDNSLTHKLEITDELITAQCYVFFAAGFETSSTTMSYALRELALNPDIQLRLQKDIDTVLLKYEGKLTYDAIQEMEYLNMIISETLRLYSPAPVLNRVCNSPYKLPGTNIFIDKGVKILIPIHGLHHDEKYFPDPEKFIPERFSKTTGNNHHPFSYLPFGEGPRNCIGARFGKLQTATGLISFLRKYSVEPCRDTPLKIELEPYAFVFQSKGGIPLKVVPRNSE